MTEARQLLLESVLQLLLDGSLLSQLRLVLSELVLVCEVVPDVSRFVLRDLAEQPALIEHSLAFDVDDVSFVFQTQHHGSGLL